MISCPECGTSNRRGSKFCGQCGQPLDPNPEIGCPECHRLNPSDSIYCAFCGARVVPLSSDSVATSLTSDDAQPPVAPEDSASRQVPSWLYDTQETTPEQPPTEASAVAVPEPPAIHPSKYLEDIQGALPDTAGWLPVNAQAEPLAKVEVPAPKASRSRGCLAVLPLLVFPHLR